MLDTIPVAHRLEPYFKIATETAHNSPCTRRQYGAVVVYPDTNFNHVAAFNDRVTTCCGGNACARDRLSLEHGSSTDVGAEIHAESAVLIRTGMQRDNSVFILVGFQNGRELLGPSVYPCHSCAREIAYAGYKYIYIRFDNRIVPTSINRILAGRQEEWSYD
jgi:deoxycytidylate deaminase